MRKRLVTGAIAVVVMLIAISVLTPPKRGSVEYHKREYLEAAKVGAIAVWLNNNPVPDAVGNFYWDRKGHRMEFHRRALIDAGYLREAVFGVSNSLPSAVIAAARIDLHKGKFEPVFTGLWERDSNTIAGLLSVDAMKRVSQVIRDADVPNKK